MAEFMDHIAHKWASDWGVQDMLSGVLGTYAGSQEEEEYRDLWPPLITLSGGAATFASL